MGSTNVKTPAAPQAPKKSEEELSLLRKQSEALDFQKDILLRQQREQQLLAPFLFSQAGLTPQKNEAGEIIGFEEEEGGLAQRRSEIEGLLLDREEAALRGELPIDPGLLKQFDQEEVDLRDLIRAQLGPGGETSTPGRKLLDDFFQRKELTFDAARRGDITSLEGLSLNRGQQGRLTAQDLILASSFGQGTAQGFGNLAGGFGGAAGRFFQDRQLTNQNNLAAFGAASQAARAETAARGAQLQGIGSLVGTSLFAPSFGKGRATNIFGKIVGR